MAHTYAFINPAMLRWARGRIGMDAATAATAIGVKLDSYQSWETGEFRPTFKQAQTAAKVLFTSFGFLFLTEPPREQSELPDLRTVGSKEGNPSLNLKEIIQQARQRQDWFVEYLNEQGAKPLDFVGKFDLNSSPQDVAIDIRKVLNIDVEQGQRSWEIYYRELIDAAERVGVLVMRSGIVGSNTHRKLDVGEFRGFAISHPLAPVVFINSSDAPSARFFTFLHELAHIWIGSSGISNVSPGGQHSEEILCNAIAGEFLAPSEIFAKLWNFGPVELADRIAELSRRFHVSKLVIIRRALDLKFVDRRIYSEFYQNELRNFQAAEGGGGNFYRNAGAKNSGRFSRAVIAEAFSGRLLLRDAGKLLGVQPSKIREFAGQLSA